MGAVFLLLKILSPVYQDYLQTDNGSYFAGSSQTNAILNSAATAPHDALLMHFDVDEHVLTQTHMSKKSQITYHGPLPHS